jgi:hypothetical protein
MIEASLIGVLKTILIIFLVITVLRFIARWAVKAGMKKMQRKMREQFEGQASQGQEGRGKQKKQFGDVTVEYDAQGRSKDGKDQNDDGDYVDFEEVDDRS